jgi:hypothetical protein
MMRIVGRKELNDFNVYLDDVLQHDVVEVDAEEGYVVRCAVGDSTQERRDGRVVVLPKGATTMKTIERCLECPYMRAPVVRNVEVSCIAEPTIRWFSERTALYGVDEGCVLRTQPRTLVVLAVIG